MLENNMDYNYKTNNWDFLDGASGITYYFDKRFSNTGSQKIKKITENSIVLLDNITIKDSKDKFILKSIINIEKHEKGFNICLSHGISSLVCILSKLYKNDIEKEIVKELITRFILYILAQQNSDIHTTGSYFPSTSIESSNGNEKHY